jgi:hypothetical protein
MNLNPGGAKPKMRDGWFMHNGQRILQPMVFPQNHPKHPGGPKGMKQILKERSLWRNGLLLICKNKMPHAFFHRSPISRNRNLLFKKPFFFVMSCWADKVIAWYLIQAGHQKFQTDN